MNKINELKKEKTNSEKIKNLREALRLAEEIKKIIDDAYQRKQHENK